MQNKSSDDEYFFAKILLLVLIINIIRLRILDSLFRNINDNIIFIIEYIEICII